MATERVRLAQLPQRVAVYDTRAVKPAVKVAEGFYLSRPWRSLVAGLLAQRGRRCEACGRTGEGGKPVRIFADHIRELVDGGAALDPRNVRLMCGSCHTTKTLAERAKRLRGGGTV
jgi:5-methylcytosine-specific restriction enzyme A